MEKNKHHIFSLKGSLCQPWPTFGITALRSQHITRNTIPTHPIAAHCYVVLGEFHFQSGYVRGGANGIEGQE